MSGIRFDQAHSPGHHNARSTPRAECLPSPALSLIIPAHNEAESLPRLVQEACAALDPLCDRPSEAGAHRLAAYEIILIDDGSTDSTYDVALTLASIHPCLSIVRLVQNVGQSAATVAGFQRARGDWIATLDADLQNDPADLARLWDVLPGHDAVLGWRERRADVWSKRVTSRIANRVRNAVLGQEIHDTGCSVRLFPREVALRLPSFRGVHRFWGPLLLREGCRIAQVPVRHGIRSHGQSHYSFRNRSLAVLVDLLGVAWLMRRPVSYQVMAPACHAGSITSLPHSVARARHDTADSRRTS